MKFRKEIFTSEMSPLAKLVYIWMHTKGSKTISVTNSEIASTFDRSVVHVSGVMRELESAGFISTSGRRRRKIFLS